MNNYPQQLELWHRFIETKDAHILNELLAENVAFHSPFVWKPKRGIMMTTAILTRVTEIFENFHYVRKLFDGAHWALEFEAEIGGLNLRGVDFIEFDDGNKIIDFEVMIRPANALQKLGEKMGEQLAAKGFI